MLWHGDQILKNNVYGVFNIVDDYVIQYTRANETLIAKGRLRPSSSESHRTQAILE